ncbi:MAG: hypothetical protein M3R58_01045 [Pseudomonadota bacterium]|nr:hypothetical protein [Pseudomonadota bacterium]
MIRLIKTNLRDFAGLFLLPFLIALLPWSLGKRLAVSISRRPWLYHGEAQTALRVARTYIPVADEAQWLYEYRLIRFFDDIDLYLWILRGNAWLRKRVTLDGSWPSEKSFVSITFHWGGGIWAACSMREAGVTISAVALALERADYGNAWVRYWYGRLRTRETARIMGGGLNFTGSAVRPLIKALAAGYTVFGLFDVPAQNSVKETAAVLFGRRAQFPRGLARIAVKQKKPVAVFLSGIDPVSLRHVITIDAPVHFEDENALTRHIAQRLEHAITYRPSAWHHWQLLDGFYAGKSPGVPGSPT